MRVSVEHNTETAAPERRSHSDPAAPDLGFLTRDFATALRSFFDTIDRITADNPVAIARLQELAGKARLGQLTEAETQELQSLKLQALRQGRAVGAVIGFFLKFKPYPMLEEIRARRRSSFNHRSVPCSSSTATPSATCSSATRSSRWSPTASR